MSFHSGAYRGARRGRGRGGSSQGLSQPPPPSKPRGTYIDNLNVATLLIEEKAPKITDVEYMASYNWVNVKSPVILVPGSPPVWAPPARDPQLKPDSAPVFRDINGARFSSYPMEPAVRSLVALQPDFDFGSIDIIACSSTIGNLLRFAGSQSRPFRFEVDMLGGIIIFVRKENPPNSMINDLRGYGHTFPDEYTTWDAGARNSCSHQRIIRYKFGGLDLLIRSETDGYVKTRDTKAANTLIEKDESNFEDVLGTMAVTSSHPGQSGTSKLELKMAGTKIPQDRIFDLKTRGAKSPFNMNEILQRLWVNQTPNFLIAYHKSGLFDKPQVKDVRDQVLEWENSNAALLRKFHAVLKRIVDVVRNSDTHQCEVYWGGQGSLCITKQEGEARRALPPDLMQMFDGEKNLQTLSQP